MGFWVFDPDSSESKSIIHNYASTSSTSAKNNTQTSSSHEVSIRTYSSVANYKNKGQISGHLRTYVAPVAKRKRRSINACSSVASCTEIDFFNGQHSSCTEIDFINGHNRNYYVALNPSLPISHSAPVEERKSINASTEIGYINCDNRNYVDLDLSLQISHSNSMVFGVWSDDDKLQLEATTQFGKLLSIDQSPSIQEVIQLGVVPRFIQFLAREGFPQLQYEAARVLTNIASGTSENVQTLIGHGAIPVFVKLLASPIDHIRKQAARALGNVAAESPKSRDLVLSHGALVSLLAHLNDHTKVSVLRTASWTLSKFCKGKPQPPFEQMRPALPAIGRLLHSADRVILIYACRALIYLSDGTHDTIQAVIESGVCPRLVELLLHPNPRVVLAALRRVANIVKGNDVQSQFMISYGLLPCLLSLLTYDHGKDIKKGACRTISNITARNKEQIQAVIEAGLVSPLVNLSQTAEFGIKKEAAWAIAKATSHATNEQIKYLVSQGCIKPLCGLLVCPDPTIVKACLGGLENILKVGEAEKNLENSGDVNIYTQMIDDAEGLDKIENLQSHENTEIYEKAVKVLETYWLVEDDETLLVRIPSGNASKQAFHFGGNSPSIASVAFSFS